MKTKDLLMDEESLFKDENVFTPNYIPEDFVHRDSQLEEIGLSLKPGLRGVNPVNALLHGPPGTGKTTAVRFIFDKLKEASGKLIPVYVNCEDFSTPYSIFARIYEAVLGVSPPSTGKPLEDVKERLFRQLKKEDKGIVIALDELDRLFLEKNVDRVLVDLLKSHATYGYDRVGVIGIMIKDDLMAELDEKARSVFNPGRVLFPQYEPGEIRDILANRARHGFYDGVLDDELLDDIVDKTHCKGDLRVGIDLLRRSALLAERDASRKIEQGHVDKAFGSLSEFHRDEASSKLSEEERILLDIIAECPGRMSGYFFMRFREKTGAGVKKYNEIVKRLERQGLIKAEYKKGVRGRSREIRLS